MNKILSQSIIEFLYLAQKERKYALLTAKEYYDMFMAQQREPI